MGLFSWIKKLPVGQIIQAGASLLGGRQSNKYNEAQARREYEHQKEFAQHGIRWKVADAQAAGLHPLFALGAQPSQYSPVAVQDSMGPAMAEAGQHIGGAIRRSATSRERIVEALQLQLLSSQIAETDARADLARSEAARARQDANVSAPIDFVDSTANPPVPEEIQVLGSHVNKPPESYIGSVYDDSVSAGENPMWGRFRIGSGHTIYLPTGGESNPSEALEALGESKVLLWITWQENVKRNGEKFTRWFFDRYLQGPAKSWWEEVKSKFNPFEAYMENFK